LQLNEDANSKRKLSSNSYFLTDLIYLATPLSYKAEGYESSTKPCKFYANFGVLPPSYPVKYHFKLCILTVIYWHFPEIPARGREWRLVVFWWQSA